MKIKNINIIERHIEKIIFGLLAIVAIYVLWAYVLSASYTADLNGQRVKPNEIEERILAAARQLENAIQTATIPEELQELRIAAYTDDFQRRADRYAIADLDVFDAPLGMHALAPDLIGETVQARVREFAITVPRQPGDVSIRHDFAVLDAEPGDSVSNDLIAMVAPSVPRDFWYVSMQATFDLGVWRQQLANEPADRRVPADWIRDSSFINDVVLERQTWNPYAGAWSDTQTIPPIPGNLSFRDHDPAPPKPVADRWIETIRLEQEQLARAPFAPIMGIRPWLPPDVTANLNPRQVSRLMSLMAEIDQLEKQLRGTAPGGASAPGMDDRPPSAMRGLGMEQEDLPPSATRGMTPTRQPVTGRSPATAPVTPTDLNAVYNRLRELREERDQLASGQRTQSTFTGRDTPLSDFELAAARDRVKVWSHDVTAQPGNIYRYRMRVGVVNPLFQRQVLNTEQRRTEYNQLSRLSAPSAWTDPIEIPRDQRFFLVSGDKSRRTARIEVWTIFNGQWRSHDFDVQPGDPIGGIVTMSSPTIQAQRDLTLDATVVDLNFDHPVREGAGGMTTRMIYMVGETGEMAGRIATEDINSPDRSALRSE